MTYITPCPYTDAECKMIRDTSKSDSKTKLQEIKAREICTQAGLQFDSTFELEDIKKFEVVCNVKVIVYDFKLDSLYNDKSNVNPRKINIILNTENEHFQFIITKINAFLGYTYYCDTCQIGYSNQELHKCKNICQSCKTSSCNQNNILHITCEDCNRIFIGEKCFKKHKYTKTYIDKTSNKKTKTLSTCDRYKKCLKCAETTFKRTKDKDINHKCGHKKCSNCKTYTNLETHECFIQKKHLPDEPKKNEKLAFWDVEAYQNSGKHIPYLIIVKDYEGKKSIYYTIDEFCEAIFNQKKWEGYTFIAHFGKGYDHQFILEWLLTRVNMTNEESDNLNKSKINVIQSGLKLMKIDYANRKFIDSFNFLPMPLRKLPKTFGFEKDVKKGYFPHFVNPKGKYGNGYEGSLPPKHYYGYYHMKVDEQKEFDSWYNQGKTFNYNLDSEAYCTDDVEVLKRACIQFQENIFDKVQIDPFSSITIASFCQKMYLTHFYDGSMAQFSNEKTTSKIGNAWLAYQEEKYSINLDREHILGDFIVDGYDKDYKIAYEFLGCYWQGCRSCFPNEYVRYNQTVYKLKELREKLGTDSVVTIWECQASKDKGFSDFLKSYDEDSQPIKYREALFGGRCEAFHLIKQIPKEAFYDDVVSLYPSVQKMRHFPKGHPKKIRNPKEFDNIWFGLIKVKILPPRNLFIPVLPAKVHYKVKIPHAYYKDKEVIKDTEKLMFALCQTCVKLNQKMKCQHSDEERAFVEVWTTEEVKEALAVGYEIKYIYEVWHIQKTKTLWKDYIDFWLKIKYEASGVPSYMSKEDYIKKVKESDGIVLDSEKIEFNPGLRAIAKLCLNSLWGKFAQRDNFTKVEYLSKFDELQDILNNNCNDVTSFDFYKANEICCIAYKSTESAIECTKNTNPVVAAFVTSWARITLLKRLQLSGMDTLYSDTDSVASMKDLPTGNCLGEWEREQILVDTFVSGGPKTTCYTVKDVKNRNMSRDICKFKGFILNAEASRFLNLKGLKAIVLGENKNHRITLINPSKITRQKDGSLVNKYEEKEYTFDYNKRISKPLNNGDIITFPYGY